MDDAVLGNINDLDKLSARQFEATTRGSVFRVAGNPQRIKPNTACQRDQQSNGAAGIAVTAIKRVNTITNVPGIHLYMPRGPDAESDGAKFLPRIGVNHSKVIRRNFVYRVGRETVQL
jgi:hypothetical protein